GQPADVVMRLDDLRRALDRDRFDDVGIEGALREVPRAGDAPGLALEDLDEAPPDDPPLLLGILDAGEALEKEVRSVHGADREAEPAERFLDLGALVSAQQAMVHEDRMEPLADRLAEKESGDGGIHSPRERADDRARRRLPADRLDLLPAEGVHRPFRLRAADAEEEVLEDLRAVVGVADLRGEADGVDLPRGILAGPDRAVRRRARDPEAGRGRSDRVAVAHPDRLLGVEPGEEDGVGRELRRRPAVLAAPASDDFAPLGAREPLHAVADAENRDAERRRVGGRRRRVLLVNALRPAREDDPGRRLSRDLRSRGGGRENHRENPRLAHPAGDQLGVLRSEIQDDDRAGAHVRVLLRTRASGRARTAAGIAAAAAPAKGAAATRSGATSDPGATRAATFSPSNTAMPLAMRNRTAKSPPKARP